jgi:hypothetical protein
MSETGYNVRNIIRPQGTKKRKKNEIIEAASKPLCTL